MYQALIAVLGGINIDLLIQTERIPAPGESISGTSLAKYPGGKGANTALAVYRASHQKPKESKNNAHQSEEGMTQFQDESINVCVYLNGAVGRDDYGTYLLRDLAMNGVDVSLVQILDGEESGTCIVIVEADTGQNRCLAFQGATKKWKCPDRNSLQCLTGGSKPDLVIAHLGIAQDEVLQVLSVAKREGIDTIFNPSPAVHLDVSIYENVTHLIMNETETVLLSSGRTGELVDLAACAEAADYFLQWGVQNVVITLAGRGAYYATNAGKRGLVEAEKDVKVVDTTGAGDTFVATFGLEYIEQKMKGLWNIERAIQRACKVSAQTIRRLGAQNSIPWADEVDLYVSQEMPSV